MPIVRRAASKEPSGSSLSPTASNNSVAGLDEAYLCPRCQQTQTHESDTDDNDDLGVSLTNKMMMFLRLRRSSNKHQNLTLKPMTRKDPATGEYLVYKGFCLRSSCFTLKEVKSALGEHDSEVAALNNMVDGLLQGNIPNKVCLDGNPHVTNDFLHNLCGAIAYGTKKRAWEQRKQQQQQNSTNQQPPPPPPKMQLLSLRNNPSLIHTIPITKVLGKLVALRLDGCPIGDTGAAALFEVLQFDGDVRLKKLSLSYCSLKSTTYIRACLMENESLTHLYLHHFEEQADSDNQDLLGKPSAPPYRKQFRNDFSCNDVANLVQETGRALQVLALPPFATGGDDTTTLFLPSAITQNNTLRQLHLCKPSAKLSLEIALSFASTCAKRTQSPSSLCIAGLDIQVLEENGLIGQVESRLLHWKNDSTSLLKESSSFKTSSTSSSTASNMDDSSNNGLDVSTRSRTARQRPPIQPSRRTQSLPAHQATTPTTQAKGVAVGIPVVERASKPSPRPHRALSEHPSPGYSSSKSPHRFSSPLSRRPHVSPRFASPQHFAPPSTPHSAPAAGVRSASPSPSMRSKVMAPHPPLQNEHDPNSREMRLRKAQDRCMASSPRVRQDDDDAQRPRRIPVGNCIPPPPLHVDGSSNNNNTESPQRRRRQQRRHTASSWIPPAPLFEISEGTSAF